MSLYIKQPIQFSATAVCVLLACGCSGSDGTSSADTDGIVSQSTVESTMTSDGESVTDTSVAAELDAATTDTSNSTINSPAADSPGTDTVGNNANASAEATAATEQELDPQIATRVDFEITVPAYMSNSLNIEVTWGSKQLWAKWVGDEYWTASDIFPTNAKLPLVVTFTDSHGDVVLASYEKEFKTGTNAAEIYQINAEQFDADKWDDDGDGVSNLSESRAGTDPLTIEAELLEIRDSYYENTGVLGFQLRDYEEMIPSFPYFVHFEDITPLTWNEDYSSYTRGLSEILTIDIDENGTGTFYDYYKYSEPSDVTVEDQGATRTNTGSSIIYTANYMRTNSGAGVRREYEISIETKAIDSATRTQIGTIHEFSSGYSDSNTADLAFTLTAKVRDAGLLCSPDYGTLTSQRVYRYRDNDFLKTTVSKGADDEFWNVSLTTENGGVVEEYLVRSLGVDIVCNLMNTPVPAKSD